MVYKTEIFLIITNLIIPITVSYITARTTLSRTIKKQIYDKRETVYFELFQLLDNLLKNPYLVYQHKEFVLPLTNMRIKLKLFASQKLINKFERLYDAILTTFERYQEKYRSETALSTNEARKSEIRSVNRSTFKSLRIAVIISSIRSDNNSSFNKCFLQ